MKIKLLNDGGYSGFDNVKFPCEVEASSFSGLGFHVSRCEILRVGVGVRALLIGTYYFSDDECEVIAE